MKLLKHLLNKDRERDSNLLDRIYLDTANRIELQSNVSYRFNVPGFLVACSLERRVIVWVLNEPIVSGKNRHLLAASDCNAGAKTGENGFVTLFIPAGRLFAGRILSAYEDGVISNDSEACMFFTPIKIKEK